MVKEQLEYYAELVEDALNKYLPETECLQKNVILAARHSLNAGGKRIRPALVMEFCRVCGGELKTRADDQDEAAINKRHDIYYDEVNGTLAAAYYFKDLAAKGETTYIELDGSGSIDAIREDLLAKLS